MNTRYKLTTTDANAINYTSAVRIAQTAERWSSATLCNVASILIRRAAEEGLDNAVRALYRRLVARCYDTLDSRL